MRYRGLLLSILTTLLLLTAFTLPSYAGWVEVDRSSGTMYISGAMIKIVPEGKDNVWTVMDLNKGIVSIINPRAKSYTVFAPDKFCSEIKSMMGNMMKEMDPEQRALMEQMLGRSAQKKAPPKVKVVKMGPGGKIKGYNTVKYGVTVNGTPYKNVWLATNAPIMNDVRKYIKKATVMSAKMESCSQVGPGVSGPAPEMSKEYTALADKGWPMKELNLRTREVEKEVLSLEKKNIPASAFRVPAGYKKVEMREMMGGIKK